MRTKADGTIDEFGGDEVGERAPSPVVETSQGIGPIYSMTDIPEGSKCQEASALSGSRYFACGSPAIAIIDNGDSRPYLMCLPCAYHNLRNRDGIIVFTTEDKLKALQHSKRISKFMPKRPDFVETSAEGTEGE